MSLNTVNNNSIISSALNTFNFSASKAFNNALNNTRTCVKAIGKNIIKQNFSDYQSWIADKKESMLNKRRGLDGSKAIFNKKYDKYTGSRAENFYSPDWNYVVDYSKEFVSKEEGRDLLKQRGETEGDFVLVNNPDVGLASMSFDQNVPFSEIYTGYTDVLYLDKDLQIQELTIYNPNSHWFFDPSMQIFQSLNGAKGALGWDGKTGDFAYYVSSEKGTHTTEVLFLDAEGNVQKFDSNTMQFPPGRQIISSSQRKKLFESVKLLSWQLGALKKAIVEDASCFEPEKIQDFIKGVHYRLLVQWMPNDTEGKLFPSTQEGFMQDFLEWTHNHPEKPSFHMPHLFKILGHYFSSSSYKTSYEVKEENPLRLREKAISYGFLHANVAINVLQEDFKNYLEVAKLSVPLKEKMNEMVKHIIVPTSLSQAEKQRAVSQAMQLLEKGIPVAVLFNFKEKLHCVGCVFTQEKMVLSNFGEGAFDFELDENNGEIGLKEYSMTNNITSEMLSEIFSCSKMEDLPIDSGNFSDSKLHSLLGLNFLSTVGGGTPQRGANCSFKSGVPFLKAGLYLANVPEEKAMLVHKELMLYNRENWLNHLFRAIEHTDAGKLQDELLYCLLNLTHKYKLKQKTLRFEKQSDLLLLNQIRQQVVGLQNKGCEHPYIKKIIDFLDGDLNFSGLTGVHEYALEIDKETLHTFFEKWSQKAKLHQRLYQMMNQTMDGVRNKAAGWVNEQFEMLTSGVLQVCASNLQGRTREITE
ncbi:MAG: hypothetical protein S4CHLAM123_01450 [Chlamydiales bacterium]|nr:hypothetical protein [Chlamydiales bacterium]